MSSATKAHRTLPQWLIALGLLVVSVLVCRPLNQPNGPSWSKAKVLADHQDHPSKIVADGEAIYFVTGGTLASKNEGTNNIKRLSLNSGSAEVLVKGGDLIPTASLAVDEKYLYWSDGGNIYRVPKMGGTSEKIIPNAPQPNEIAMDADNIYWLLWTGEGSPPQPIMYAPRQGGEVKQLTPPQPPTSGLCLDGDFVYFMTGDGLKKVARGGGEVSVVWHNPAKHPSLGLQQDAENFYFCQMNDKGKSALMKLNKKTGEVTQLATSINHTMEFTLRGENIYYFDEVPGRGSFGPVALRKISTRGGEPTELDQGNAGWIKYSAADMKQIYFTDISKVYALPK